MAAGIDGFALNAGGWVDSRGVHLKAVCQRYFEAALGTDFKLFMSPDMGALTRADVQDMMDLWKDHPNYFYHEGKQFLSAYSAQVAPNDWWQKTIAGRNIFFAPQCHVGAFADSPNVTEAEIAAKIDTYPICDGFHYFGAAGIPTNTDSEFSITFEGEAWSRVCASRGKFLMGTFGDGYWGQRQVADGRRYYDYQFGEGMEHQIRSLLGVQTNVTLVEFVTWNDFLESYIAPIKDADERWPHFEPRQAGYHKSRAGALGLLSYFIQWFKAGEQPPILRDQLFWSYRTHPKDAVARNDPLGPVTQLNGNPQDVIYITTLLTAPATLKVATGDARTMYTIPAGMSHRRIFYNVGKQRFELERNGAVIARGAGDDVIAKPRHTNFWHTTGMAAAK